MDKIWEVFGGKDVISGMPAEIMSLIFEYLRGSRSRLFSERLMDSEDNSLLSVSHVCRYWRQIAFGHAALWASEVDVSAQPHLDLTVFVLAKSASCPLDIKLMHVDETYACTCLPLWFIAAQRIRSLNITTIGPRASNDLVHFLGLDLPRLRSISLCNESVNVIIDIYDEDPLPALPHVRTLRVRSMFPSLKRIALRDYVLPWEMVELYSQVTHLKIGMSGYYLPSQRPSPDELHDIIVSMEMLEVLSLDDIFPLYPDDEPPTPILISSTCHSITLRASNHHSDCGVLAATLVVPLECDFTITLVCRTQVVDAGDIVEDLAGPSHRPRWASIHTQEHVFDPECGKLIVGYDTHQENALAIIQARHS
ncbi:hypothetical protein PENSPDRAFT_758488 [Peniophora sp. CONT]|nr:hypothetical protein PENSPDRAFT_758488 [Peniophora sp. CONT]